jgi:hypothetical protein
VLPSLIVGRIRVKKLRNRGLQPNLPSIILL